MKSPFEFPLWISQAMLSLVKKTIKTLSETQNPHGHSFYITFITQDKKAIVPKQLLSQFPKAMTIVLENQFSNLVYDNNGFSVDLSFNDVLHSLYIPFNAIINFSDKLSNINITLDYNAKIDPKKIPAKSGNGKNTSKNNSDKKSQDTKNKDNIIIFPKS
jgi:hypothetical protein